jgi:hypothetical protein
MNPESSQPDQNRLILTPPEALVIHCSDYRFQAAMRAFLRGVTTHSYDLLAIPGGPHFAAARYFLPKYHTIGKQNVTLLVELHQLKRLILIDHTDCAFFQRRLSFFYAGATPDEQQIVSATKSRNIFQEWLPSIRVDAYFARLAGGDTVSFSSIL